MGNAFVVISSDFWGNKFDRKRSQSSPAHKRDSKIQQGGGQQAITIITVTAATTVNYSPCSFRSVSYGHLNDNTPHYNSQKIHQKSNNLTNIKKFKKTGIIIDS